MKYLVLALAVALAGCGDYAQNAIDESGYVCKDGVEYFVYEKYNGQGVSFSVVPHFKPDGSLYTCTRKVEK